MLYEKSKNEQLKGLDLYSIIISEANILLAYRNVKSNKGSKTRGTDNKSIEDLKLGDTKEFITQIQGKLKNYKPSTIRRVYIPKTNGKLRPLGIPTIGDRIIQQMFKQVLEPIVEAKFHKHSYGFRPNRSAHHAIARCYHLINQNQLHYVVDIDIKGFFENVNHNKLMKQLYSIGVKDKRVLAIIKKMLSAPIKGYGVPNKGTPQGGILSPLLANVVLNEFDWWLSNQWETFNSRHKYSNTSKMYRALKETKLKEMFVVRYADDFKVFVRTPKQAEKIYHAIREHLKDRLNLDISPEKSQITNLRRRGSDFLGFEIRAVKKKRTYVANSHISKKQIKRTKDTLKNQIKEIQKGSNNRGYQAWKYNMLVMGIQNYFQYATHVSPDLSRIGHHLVNGLHNRLKKIAIYELPRQPSKLYKMRYRNKMKTYKVNSHYLFPIGDIRMKKAMNFKPNTCSYTKVGRTLLHKNLSHLIHNEIEQMVNSHQEKYTFHSIEYLDNRISRYSMQKGQCYVTGKFLTADEVHCHHITPTYLGGNDKFSNLIIISKEVHKLIHAIQPEVVKKYMVKLKLNEQQLIKLNNFRKKCNLNHIISFH